MTDWPTTRARIIDAFNGELPGAPLEQAIVDIYEAKPEAVLDAYPGIATQLKAGKLNSGWAVLRKAASERATRQANPTISKDRAVRNAEQWIRNAGLHYPTWTEAADELYTERGLLHQHRTDANLEQRLATLWDELHPLSVIADQDHERRLAEWRQQINQLEPAPDGGRTPEQLQKLATLKSQQPLPGDHLQGAA